MAAADFELGDPAGPDELAGEFGKEVVAGGDTDAVGLCRLESR